MIRRIQLTLLALFVSVLAMASETCVKNADGVEIWYNFDSSTKTASVTYKGWSPYSNNDRYIGNVVIPSKVTYEGEEYGVTSIVENAFSRCSSLTSVTIPKSVTWIGRHAFSGCSSLTSIDVALDNNSYTSINGVLFSKDKTILIQYPGDKKDVTSYAIPESVTSIEDYAFSGCSSLTSITLPKGVTEIGNYAFCDCSSLTSITIPEGVTCIGIYTFRNCSSLTSITLPEGVTEIGGDAFRFCSSLTSITSMNVTPPLIGDGYTFDGFDKSIPVYVPKQSVEAYKSAKYWKNFTNIQGIDDTPITDVVADSVSIRLIGNAFIVEGAESYAVYALSGQNLGKVESLERGVYIVVADGVSKKIVVK